MTDNTAAAEHTTPAISAAAKNAPLILLLSLGLVLLFVGGPLAIVNGGQITHDSMANDFYNVLSSQAPDTPSVKVAADTAWMWGGIVAAVIGVVALLVACVVATIQSTRTAK